MNDSKPTDKPASLTAVGSSAIVRRLKRRVDDWKQLEYVRRRERNFWREKYLKTEKALHFIHVAQAKIYNITAENLWPAQEERQTDSPNTQAQP